MKAGLRPGSAGLTITGAHDYSGGAVTAWEAIPLTIDNCIFFGNKADDRGGAVAVFAGQAVITNTLFLDNSATYGGALAVLSLGTLEMEGCVFAGNEANQGGALLLNGAGLVFARNCTLADNQAPQGAGLHVASSVSDPMLMENCLVAFNDGGEGLYWDGNGLLELIACDIFGNAGGDWVGPIAGQLGLRDNFTGDPLFCRDLNPGQPYTLGSGSSCSAAYDPVRGQVGALLVGCVMTSVSESPRFARLHPCVPNPFNPRTTIAFDLALTASVDLCVYDISGRMVRTLVGAVRLPAGRHEATWDGADTAGHPAPAGVYFYALKAGGYSATGRMTLVK